MGKPEACTLMASMQLNLFHRIFPGFGVVYFDVLCESCC